VTTTRQPILRVAGTSLGVERLRDVPRLAIAASWLLGPKARWVVRESTRGNARMAEQRWAHAASRLLGIRLSILGLHHIQPDRQYIVAPLHEGFADVLALLHLPLRLRFVARTELTEWPLLGPALAAGGHIVVTPEEPRAAYRTLRREAPIIRAAGDSLVIFPQGSLLGIETAFNAGVFAIAETTGQPVLPVVITGTHRVWEHPFSPIVRFQQRVVVRVLPPMYPPFDTMEQRSLERRMKEMALSSGVAPRRYVPERDGFWDGYRFEIDEGFRAVADMVQRHRSMLSADAPGISDEAD
jgi:1-acyl-sn-glycerol-3-phosphate acyltransferase